MKPDHLCDVAWGSHSTKLKVIVDLLQLVY